MDKWREFQLSRGRKYYLWTLLWGLGLPDYCSHRGWYLQVGKWNTGGVECTLLPGVMVRIPSI